MTRKPKRPLTPAQRRFFRQLVVDCRTLGEAMTVLNLTPAHLARWLTRPGFVRELRRSVSLMQKLRETEIRTAAFRAAGVLSQTADAKPGSVASRQACAELIRLARDADARKRRRAERQRPAKAGSASPIHPDLPEDERRTLIDQLRSEQAT